MRIKEEYKVREMAGEHIVVMQGRYGVDMTMQSLWSYPCLLYTSDAADEL